MFRRQVLDELFDLFHVAALHQFEPLSLDVECNRGHRSDSLLLSDFFDGVHIQLQKNRFFRVLFRKRCILRAERFAGLRRAGQAQTAAAAVRKERNEASASLNLCESGALRLIGVNLTSSSQSEASTCVDQLTPHQVAVKSQRTSLPLALSCSVAH